MTTKTTTRRSFTDEFKREAVSLLASSGRPLIQVATELGTRAVFSYLRYPHRISAVRDLFWMEAL